MGDMNKRGCTVYIYTLMESKPAALGSSLLPMLSAVGGKPADAITLSICHVDVTSKQLQCTTTPAPLAFNIVWWQIERVTRALTAMQLSCDDCWLHSGMWHENSENGWNPCTSIKDLYKFGQPIFFPFQISEFTLQNCIPVLVFDFFFYFNVTHNSFLMKT